MLRVEKEMLIWWWSFHKLLPGRVESWKLLNPVGLSAALGICRLQTASLLSLSFVQNSGPDLDDWLQPRQSQYHYQLLSSSRPATRACKYTLSIHVFLPGYTWTVLEFWGQWNICKVRTNRQNKQQIKELKTFMSIKAMHLSEHYRIKIKFFFLECKNVLEALLQNFKRPVSRAPASEKSLSKIFHTEEN